MIIYGILKFFLNIASAVSNWIGQLGSPDISFTWVDDFLDGIDIVLYLFPLYKLQPLIIAIIFFTVLRLLIALANEIFNAIPMY